MPKDKKVKDRRGGKRSGSGRPRKTAVDRVVIQAWVSPEAKLTLRAMMRPGEDGFGDLLERIARDHGPK